MTKLIILFVILIPILTFSQNVSINNDGSEPHHTAILDIQSNQKGVLFPRLSTLERTSIAGPALGLTVFDMDTYSYWMYRGDLWGGWAELQHQYQNFWQNSGINLYNTNPGNIGIGTNFPTSKLTINGINPSISLMNDGIGKGFLMISGDNIYMGTNFGNTDGKINFGLKGTTRMSLSQDGRFGIGITDPLSKLQVTGGTDASLDSHGFIMVGHVNSSNLVIDNNEILARSNGNSANLHLQEEGGNVFIGDPSPFNSAHRLGVNGHTVITGNLRVGNISNPSGYKLAVDGKVLCTELMVRLTSNWPDYVFASDYKLPKLDDVEKFIKLNHHLPGIPKAEEIESGGMNLGEMQKLQMEKIEELTLYVIELKKEIENLKAQK
ncbi:MAG: hypothetical protein IPM42_20045 [Saprospiraceae bacterium]|nr:hypothetical protein [Saprospiraceae bacterium]